MMATAVALLSGKGGSGKTTLGLGMATLLSNCEIKVLLIDCDLCTNGATYFYESKLLEYSNYLNSFYDVLLGKYSKENSMINVTEYMDFMPSIARITKESAATYSYTQKGMDYFTNFKNSIDKFYDIIIFDCQAGYTDVLKIILSKSDTALFVMEPDAVSPSAIRGLFLKVGEFLPDNTYQVFNKVTEEEYKIYHKVSGGTIFTNIETIKFDWKIRKAFSLAEVPDIEVTSVDYGMKIFKVCKRIFRETSILEKLKKFNYVIKLKQHREKEEQLLRRRDMVHEKAYGSNAKVRRYIYALLALTSVLLACSVLAFTVNGGYVFDSYNTVLWQAVLTVILTAVLAVGFMYSSDVLRNRKKYKKQIDIYDDQLLEMHKLEQKLHEEYENYSASEDEQENDKK